MLHLDHTYEKSVKHLLTIQKTLILLCQCIICQGIVTIILRRLEVYGIIIEIKQNDSANENHDANNYRINTKKKKQKTCKPF